jgi:hypothetical protein
MQATTLELETQSYTLRNVRIDAAMVLKEGTGAESIVDLKSLDQVCSEFEFTVSSISSGKWTTHAMGNIQINQNKPGTKRKPN